MKNYDLVIVGMGPSAIFCAYELLELNPNKKILLIEKGKRIENRVCPLKQTNKCLKCKPICSIIGGFSGAGAFSDGKLLSYHLSSYNKENYDLYIGGKDDSFIKQFYSKEEIMSLMKYTDDVYLKFGANPNLSGLDCKEEIDLLKQEAKDNNLELIDVPVRHLGTEASHALYRRLQDYLEKRVDMLFNTEVTDLIIENDIVQGVVTSSEEVYADKVILAVGVDGGSKLSSLCRKYNIKTRNGYMDIGIRYELSNDVMSRINNLLYEGKFIGRFAPFYDKVRSFCTNPGGFVTFETYDNGITLVNGHAYKDKKSKNTNLALLASYKIDEPFNNSIEYCFNIGKKANLISGGSPIIQRYGDFKNGFKTSRDSLINNSVKPTLEEAYPYDLSYVLDYRTCINLINYIEQMNKIIPGFNSDDNLMYGPEIKFYSNEIIVDKDMQTSIKNLYSIGTGGGLTIGLMNASLSGVLMARRLEGRKII